MTFIYERPPNNDFAAAAEFETQVAEKLGSERLTLVGNHSSTTKFDIVNPGWILDVKEKRKPYGKMFLRFVPAEWPERNVFILDELAIRRGLWHDSVSSFFLIRDVPAERLFFTSVMEVAMMDRVRVNRRTSERTSKGKWLVNLEHMRQVGNVSECLEVIQDFEFNKPYHKSPCMSWAGLVPDVS